MEILFEDNHQLVLNKKAGLLTQPSGTEQESLEVLAKSWLKQKYAKPGNVFLEAIHRLDKPVSGIVVFAKTSKALSRLQECMRRHQSEKRYVALVEGKLSQPAALLEHYLVHDDFQASVVNPQHPASKKAQLTYQVIQEIDGKSLIEIQLLTGRYHQIRAQFAAIGHPVVGDEKYGSHIRFLPGAIALHHQKFQIPHPITGEMQVFVAPVPF